MADETSVAPEPIDIGTRNQLFIDDRLIETADGIDLSLKRPELQREDLLTADEPWEMGRVMSRGSIVHHDGTFKLWYDARERMEDPGYQEGPGPSNTRRLCYAESEDGIHFQKPNVGPIEYEGSVENNIVVAGCHGSVFVDPHDDPDRRFKAIMQVRPELQTLEWDVVDGAVENGIYLLYSSDGIHWHRSEEVVFPMALGATQSVIWDDRLGTWVLYLRAHTSSEYSSQRRKFGRVEIPPGELDQPYPYDPIPDKVYDPPGQENLTQELPIVLDWDSRDPQGVEAQPYLMNAWKYPHGEDVYLAFPPMWYRKTTSMIEPQLAISRDGTDWRRPWRRALIPAGHASFWNTGGQVWPVMDPVVTEDEIWLYYLTMPEAHMERQDPDGDSRLGRAIWHRDRFASADSGTSTGTFTTPPVTFSGDELVVNFDAGAWGSLEVGITDVQDRSIPGYSLRDARKLRGNELSARASWETSWDGGAATITEVGDLAGEVVKLQFRLVNCELYSFRTRDR